MSTPGHGALVHYSGYDSRGNDLTPAKTDTTRIANKLKNSSRATLFAIRPLLKLG
jgi:nitric oxide synthase oxygenase domain/subunit